MTDAAHTVATPEPYDPPLRVLVTGVGGPSGRAVTAALRARRFFVLGVDMNVVGHAGDDFAQVPSALDPAYPDALRSLIRKHGIGWLFPTVSEELVTVARLADEFRAQRIAVYISAPEAVAICGDKWTTAQAMQRLGIAVPASAVGSRDAPSVRRLNFPVVSRPRVGRGGRNVVVHDGPGIAPTATDPIWQEFMCGTEYDVLMLRDPDPPHRLLTCQVFEKIRLKEGRVGNALEVEPVEAADVAALAGNAARGLSLTGPLDMDIRRGDDGVPRLIEINARVGAHASRVPALFDALSSLARAGNLG